MRPFLLAFVLVGASTAFAQSDDDDAPLSYGDEVEGEDTAPKKKRKSYRATDELREEDEDEAERDYIKPLASLDDPNVGVGGDIFIGLAFPDSSRGGVNPRFLFGLRFTWEFGRLLAGEYLREMFFVDVAWSWINSKDGSGYVDVDTNLHNLTLAPALAIPFGEKSPAAFYAQVGLGVNISDTITTIGDNSVKLMGSKFLFQYGLGLRFRPAVVGDGSVRLQFRIEVTRFIRGYMHDMYFAGGAGLIF